ncbi:hypothetical protein CTAYLR_009094 [Chrysophaeum taylorii]|uniref:Uncharacterized protein n=1 Tax=Chrysophaeum taylorii TaxID=2483200 RepID=A0AAD7XLI3_9STRA|nr:hypothetical protein CTAYLR_009094 [Chrysophaeum taylorii]
MRWLIALGVVVACAQFVYLATLVQEHTLNNRPLAPAVVVQEPPAVVLPPPPPFFQEGDDVMARIGLVTDFVREIHAAFGPIRPKGFGLRNSPQRPSDEVAWRTFYDAVSRLLFETPKYEKLRRFEKVRRRPKTIFVSISSFRDEVCPDTLDNLYSRASNPENIFVGLVQQNCDERQHAAYGCFTAVMPSDMKVHPAPPDLDCARTYCARPTAFEPACSSLLRVLRFNESETFGPVFGRYLGSLLWRDEEFYMQVDAHTTFARGWDDILISDYDLAPSKRPVFSHYPPSGPQKPAPGNYAWERQVGTCMCDAGFAEYSIVRVGAMNRYPIKETVPPNCGQPSETCRHVPRFAPFIGAGFVFANASFLVDVPFDPFLPWIFMGEELDFSTRLWTSGWDIFCPPRNALAHAYLRPQKPKFWGALQRSIGAGAHNSLQQFVLPRVKHKVGYPEALSVDQLKLPTLAAHLDLYGIGTRRSLQDYLALADLDFVAKRPARVAWCKAGDRPPGLVDTYPILHNNRSFRHVFLTFFIILFAFFAFASKILWIQWTTATIMVFFFLLFDLIFLDESQFIFDPDPDNWRRRVEASRD